MRNAAIDEMETGICIGGRNLSNLRYANDITLLADSEENLHANMCAVRIEGEKMGLYLNMKKIKIMSTADISSFSLDGNDI